MNLINAITEYFSGEKIEALVFILPIGLLSLVFGAWLLSEGGSFFQGVAVPFIIMGLVMTVVGGVVGYRTPSQVTSLKSGLTSDPGVTLQNELQRMEKVNGAWIKYLVVWGLFAVAGIILRFLFKNDFAQGLGISLIFFSGVTLLIDGFAERRAKDYAHAVKAEAEKLKQ